MRPKPDPLPNASERTRRPAGALLLALAALLAAAPLLAAAAPQGAAGGAPFPRPLDSYGAEEGMTVGALLAARVKAEPLNLAATVFSLLAVVHTFLAPRFLHASHALRDRREDIPLLIDYFTRKFNKKLNKGIVAVSEDVQRIFMEHEWPGNIRELEHTLEHAFILCRRNTITMDDLPIDFKELVANKNRLPGALKDDEPRAIVHALEKSAWNKAKAARLLGISRRTIYRKIEEYKLMKELRLF